jgi:hypothetical protein
LPHLIVPETPSLAEQYGPYDEALMVGHTVLYHRPELLTPFENDVRVTFFFRAKASAYKNPEFERRVRVRMGIAESPAVEEVVAEGFNSFKQQVGERVIREGLLECQLNRCPACSKIAITPLAQWCIWCKHDWHPKSVGTKE